MKMTRIASASIGATPFMRLLGHHQGVMERWGQLSDALEGDGHLTKELKEQVRRVLAFQNGCLYCQAKGRPDPEVYDEKTSVAVGFAEVFGVQGSGVQDSLFHVLKESFSDEETSELIAFISFTSASQTFGALMDLRPEKN